MNDTPAEKICNGCKIVKPLGEFHACKGGKYGTTTKCKVCRKAIWLANSENNKAYRKVYYQENRERFATYYKPRPPRPKKVNKGVYKPDPQRRREITKKYRLANLETVRACEIARDARRRAAEGSFTGKEWRAKLKLYKGYCHWCHKKIKGTPHADHVIALSKGGTNYIDNVVPSCAKCNLAKSAKSPLEFAGRLF